MNAVAERLPALITHARARLERIRIRDFRNLARADFPLSPEGLTLVGENGQGKTNLLEAVYYLQLLRSFRGARDQDLVRFGTTGFHLHAEVVARDSREIAVGFDRASQKKKITLDGTQPARLADALGAFPAVIFSPQDIAFVSGAPSERRRFLDVVLALTSRPYLIALQRYRAALARRNAALREASRRGAKGSIEVWEPALAEYGALVMRARHDWVEWQASRFAELCEAIGEQGKPTLRYASSVPASAVTEQALRDALERKRDGDIQRGLTQTGPHRDDLHLTLDGRDLRVFGSAGQQRTAAIALRLLEAATLRERFGTEPVVLLDDPFAELDHRRAGGILDLLNSEGRGQTLLAVPRLSDIPGGLTRLDRWRVEKGSVSPETV